MYVGVYIYICRCSASQEFIKRRNESYKRPTEKNISFVCIYTYIYIYRVYI